MTSIPVGELRNDVSAVLRRVEAGERLMIAVSGRDVAELVPIERRPRFVSCAEFMSWPKTDLGLAAELREELSETTDGIPPLEW